MAINLFLKILVRRMVEAAEKSFSRRSSLSSTSSRGHKAQAILASDLEGLSLGDRLDRLSQLEEASKLYDEKLSAT